MGEMGGVQIHAIRSRDVIRFCREFHGVEDLEELQEICVLVAEMDLEYMDYVQRRREAGANSTK